MKSPCIKECKLTVGNKCSGCGRKIEEIATWHILTDVEKASILERIKNYDKITTI